MWDVAGLKIFPSILSIDLPYFGIGVPCVSIGLQIEDTFIGEIAMEIGHTEIYVKSPMEAKDFYVNVLGFELEVIQHEKFVWLNKGKQVILLKPGRKAPTPSTYQEAPSAVVFYTNNLDKTVEELKDRGLKFLGTDGSDRCLTFTDPDGNWFQLVDPNSH